MLGFSHLKNLYIANTKFFSDFLSVFSLRFLQMGLSFATAYFLARALSKEQFGEYHYILGWVGVLSIFALPGLSDSVMQAISRGKDGTYRKAAKLAFISCLVGSLGFLTGAIWFYYKQDIEMTLGFAVAFVLFPFLHGMSMWTTVGQGREEFKKLSRIQATNAIMMSSLQIIFLLFIPNNLIVPLAIIMGIPALQNMYQTYKRISEIPRHSEEEEGNINFGIKQTLYSILSVLSIHIDKILLYNFLSPTQLAVFMAAQKLTEPVQSVTQDLSAMLAPKFAKFEHLTRDVDRLFYYYSVAIGAGIILFSFTILPWVVVLVFGEQYADSVPYCQALMCTVALGNVATLRFRFIRSRMSVRSVRNITFGNSILRFYAPVLVFRYLV